MVGRTSVADRRMCAKGLLTSCLQFPEVQAAVAAVDEDAVEVFGSAGGGDVVVVVGDELAR